MEFVAPLPPDMRLRCRGAFQRPAYDCFPSSILRDGPLALLRMRGWRAERRKSYGVASGEDARAPLGAPEAAI